MGHSPSTTDAVADAVKAIDAIEEQTDPRSVLEELGRCMAPYGFKTVAAAQLANPAMSRDSELLRISTWPKSWADYWLERNLLMSDPIAKMACIQNNPFKWSEAFDRDKSYVKQHRTTLHEFGVSQGWTIPVRTGDGPPGCISLGCDELDLSPADLAVVELVSVHAYVVLEKLTGVFKPMSVKVLTHRESEILHFVAAGKTNWEVAQILSISEYHVRDCLKNICKKLNAANRAHAVANAMRNQLILP